MTHTPIGVGPATNTAGIRQAKDANGFEALQFQTRDKGSTTTELLRGKIGQMRGAEINQPDTSPTLSFRQQLNPSAATLHLMGRLPG